MTRLWTEIRAWWQDYTKGLDMFAAFALVFSTCLIILCEEYGSSGYYRHNFAFGDAVREPFLRMMPHMYWFASSFFFYGFIPYLVLLFTRKKVADFGLTLGDWRYGLKTLALFSFVMIVVVLIAVQTPSFANHYPFNKTALRSLGFFVTYEYYYMMYFLAWEFFFRGFLLFALYRVIGNWAILVQMIPFALLHIGKPVPEVFASVFAGLILGALALRTRSMLYCFLLHAISAFAMDFSVFVMKGNWNW